MIIWLVLAGLPVLASFIIAWRIYANFQPQQHFAISKPKLFLLKQPQQFSITQLINYPYREVGRNWSIEWLIKGSQPALVIYAPVEFVRYTKLEVTEIEDYAQHLFPSNTEVHQFQWTEQESHKMSDRLISQLFSQLKLGSEEKIGWQLVFNDQQLNQPQISCQLFLMVSAVEASRRRQLVTQTEEFLSQNSPLFNAHSSVNLVDYQYRILSEKRIQLKREQFNTLAANNFS